MGDVWRYSKSRKCLLGKVIKLQVNRSNGFRATIKRPESGRHSEKEHEVKICEPGDGVALGEQDDEQHEGDLRPGLQHPAVH